MTPQPSQQPLVEPLKPLVEPVETLEPRHSLVEPVETLEPRESLVEPLKPLVEPVETLEPLKPLVEPVETVETVEPLKPLVEPVETVCSARGCTALATWSLLWNNPKLHTPERRKTWLACEAHRQSLGDFLGARGFLREVEPFPTRRESRADPS